MMVVLLGNGQHQQLYLHHLHLLFPKCLFDWIVLILVYRYGSYRFSFVESLLMSVYRLFGFAFWIIAKSVDNRLVRTLKINAYWNPLLLLYTKPKWISPNRLARYHYIMEYSKKYNFPTKKSRTTCYMMSERIHKLMDDIKPSISDENLQPSESDGELIKPYLATYN